MWVNIYPGRCYVHSLLFSLGGNLPFLPLKSNVVCWQQNFAYTRIVYVACCAVITVLPSYECVLGTSAQKILSHLVMVQFCLDIDLLTSVQNRARGLGYG